MKNAKRGISPVIATVLLIIMAIAAGLFVFMFMRGMIGEQVEKFGKPVENWCGQMSYDATISGNAIEINNMASVPIYAINVQVSRGGQSSVIFARPSEGIIGPGQISSINVNMAGADKIKVTPLLYGKGKNSNKAKLFPCDVAAKYIQ